MPCQVRIEQISNGIYLEGNWTHHPCWLIQVFEVSEIFVIEVHSYEGPQGETLSDVLQRVFLRSCQGHAR